MNPMLIGGIAGAGAGLLQNYQKRAQQLDQAKANAMLAQISPWNSIYAQMIKEPEKSGGLASIVQGAGAGAAQGGEFSSLDKQQSAYEALLKKLTQNSSG